jgi:hypothetical protein
VDKTEKGHRNETDEPTILSSRGRSEGMREENEGKA